MTDLLLIAVAAATINNLVLERLLGLCPVLNSRGRLRDLLHLGLATTGTLTAVAGLTHLLHAFVLVPYDLAYLRIVSFLALTAIAVQLANSYLQRHGSGQTRAQLPLVTTNCAILGVALLTTGTTDNIGEALALGVGAGLGFTLAMLLFASLRPRLEQSPVPAPLRGPALALLTVGMMSLAFLGFSGMGT